MRIAARWRLPAEEVSAVDRLTSVYCWLSVEIPPICEIVRLISNRLLTDFIKLTIVSSLHM